MISEHELRQTENLLGNIPDEMRTYAHWVVWKLEQRDASAGYPTKMPYIAGGGVYKHPNLANVWHSLSPFPALAHGLETSSTLT